MTTKIYTRRNIDSDSCLELDGRWKVSYDKKPKTLQYFITSKCNERCPDCFFMNYLGNHDVLIDDYKRFVLEKFEKEGLEKVNFLGGEPTLYKDLGEALKFNSELGLKTHIYSNGARLNKINYDLFDAKIRLSVLSYDKIKPINKIKTDLPLTVVMPLNKDNVSHVPKILDYCSNNLNVSEFVFSTIKKLKQEGDFFEKKDGCLTANEYIAFLNSFFESEIFGIGEYHINSRGIFDLGDENTSCNFMNKLPDVKEVSCPFDIDIGNFSEKTVSWVGIVARMMFAFWRRLLYLGCL